MEVAGWREAIVAAGEHIMRHGGELCFRVVVRGNERLPSISVFPENYIKCKTEILLSD
jgi:hypothetical protein